MKLHDYQVTAVNHVRAHPRAGLFLDMGLGKTAATLSSLRPEDLPVLVVAPKRVAEDVWPLETAKWRPDLSCEVAVGGPAKRRQILDESTADVVALGRDNMGDLVELDRRKVLRLIPSGRRWRTVVLDELSGFKNKDTERWRTAAKLCGLHFAERRLQGLRPDAPRVIGLTGTPAPNGLHDLWGQLTLLDGGERLGTSLGRYRSEFFTPGRTLPNGVVTKWKLLPGAEDRIYGLIDDICLSMVTEGRIVLPPVTHNQVRVPMPAKIRDAYRILKRDRVMGAEVLGREIIDPVGAAALGAKLSQLAAGFLYVDNTRGTQWDVFHQEKVKAVVEVVEGTGSPVLVFYRFRAELEMLRKAMPDARTVDEPGVFRAWDAGEVPVLLAHPAAIGHGLNMQHGGYTAVWTSPTWDLEQWEQANKRLIRQGQQHPVVIHELRMDGSVDDAMYDVLEGKASVQEALFRHLDSPI